ncbi:DNA-binding NarL/FixJ family response regulator [Paenibacillus shirakamiensis]|uniref:DNA-binding NarL/FixJ family response regulator n=1 Tax=Paenibacillus shirakamiensis TaxID=1265935 RepID=A0ABS4JH86_9BACL|nr:hypothetical protein [Paenibacillus shirakamiensis]MBP2001090.1 DNA-binding NarL/FixJ family response regulator [Paenibacillus shirakamiensis]
MSGSPWLYVVLLGAAAIVYSLMLPKRKEQLTEFSTDTSQVEATMEHYMSEIERENLEIVELVAQIRTEAKAQRLSLQEQVTELRTRLSESDRSYAAQDMRIQLLERSFSVDTATAAENVARAEMLKQENEKSVPVNSASQSVRDRYADLFELHNQGKSMDAIAKALGIQRGEVQLILQLANKEEIFL